MEVVLTEQGGASTEIWATMDQAMKAVQCKKRILVIKIFNYFKFVTRFDQFCPFLGVN